MLYTADADAPAPSSRPCRQQCFASMCLLQVQSQREALSSLVQRALLQHHPDEASSGFASLRDCHSDGCQHVATEMDSFTTELLCQKPSHAITKPTPSPELNAAHHCSLTESLKFHCRQLPRLADRLPKPPEQGRAVFVLHIFGTSDDTTSALCLSSLQALPVSCGSVD